MVRIGKKGNKELKKKKKKEKGKKKKHIILLLSEDIFETCSAN